MTVTPYYGLAGSDKATALLSSVSGVFTIGNGTGTYDSSKTPTGQLILSSSAQKGTYRLLFEIKNLSDNGSDGFLLCDRKIDPDHQKMQS